MSREEMSRPIPHSESTYASAPASPAGREAHRDSWRQLAEPALLFGGSVLLIAFLLWPVLFTNSEMTGDWIKHLWFISHQSQSIATDHHPSFFFYHAGELFYPLFAFYGGTIFALAGAFSLVLGHSARTAYALSYLVDISCAYAGWYWLGRIAGLRRWLAAIPGALFITSPYYLSLIYARGDWPEFTGISMVSLVLASGWSVLRADRIRALPALALTGSVLVFGGSHNLTVIWASTLIGLFLLLTLLLVPAARKPLDVRRVGRLAILAIPAFALNAWFLIPDIAYQAHTVIASKYPLWRMILSETEPIVRAGKLFAIVRSSTLGPTEAKLMITLPVLAIAWLCVSYVLLVRPRWGETWTRVLLIASLMAALVTVMMTHVGLLLALPRALAILQFSYRLDSYPVIAICAAVLAALVLFGSGEPADRSWSWVLIPVVAISIAGGIQQVNASFVSAPIVDLKTLNPELGDYANDEFPIVTETKRLAVVHFPQPTNAKETASVSLPLRPHERVETNVMSYTPMLHFTGAKVVALDNTDHTVLEVDPPAPGQASSRGLQTISVRPADTPPVVIGRVLSLLAIAILLAIFGKLALDRLSTRNRSRRGSLR